MAEAAGDRRPMVLPGPLAATGYFAAVASVVLFRLAVKRYKLFPAVLGLCLIMQISAVVVVPLIVLVIRWRGGLDLDPVGREGPSFAWLPRKATLSGMAFFVLLHYLARTHLSELEMWRLASGMDLLAFLVLAMRLFGGRGAAGISAHKLLLDAPRLGARLGASLLLGRKMPRRSADPIAQALDAGALFTVVALLAALFLQFRSTYQAAGDRLRAPLLAAGAAALVLPLRAQLGGGLLPDALFTLGLYLEIVAPLPMLQLGASNGGVFDEASSHHLALGFAGRALALTFWWSVRSTWVKGTAFTGWLILIAAFLPLIVLWHYMCYYFRALFSRSLFSGVPLVCDQG